MELGIFIVNLTEINPTFLMLHWCNFAKFLLLKKLIHFHIRNFIEYRKGKEKNKNHFSMSPNVFLSINPSLLQKIERYF